MVMSHHWMSVVTNTGPVLGAAVQISVQIKKPRGCEITYSHPRTRLGSFQSPLWVWFKYRESNVFITFRLRARTLLRESHPASLSKSTKVCYVSFPAPRVSSFVLRCFEMFLYNISMNPHAWYARTHTCIRVHVYTCIHTYTHLCSLSVRIPLGWSWQMTALLICQPRVSSSAGVCVCVVYCWGTQGVGGECQQDSGFVIGQITDLWIFHIEDGLLRPCCSVDGANQVIFFLFEC